MLPITSSAAPADAPDASAAPALQTVAADAPTVASVTHERLARLFRHTLRTGEVNPLLHIVPRYRQEPLP